MSTKAMWVALIKGGVLWQDGLITIGFLSKEVSKREDIKMKRDVKEKIKDEANETGIWRAKKGNGR